MLQLELSSLRLTTLHSGSSPALPFTYWGYLLSACTRMFNFQLNAHLKFMVYGHKQTYVRILQWSHASVELTQARPNQVGKPWQWGTRLFDKNAIHVLNN